MALILTLLVAWTYYIRISHFLPQAYEIHGGHYSRLRQSYGIGS